MSQFVQRIPNDVRERAVGRSLAIPIGSETVQLTISPHAEAIRFSLRTRDPSETKRRQAEAAAYLETVWQALRENSPISGRIAKRQHLPAAYIALGLPAKAASAPLPSSSCRAVNGTPDYENPDNVPDFWEFARQHLDQVEAADDEFQAEAGRRESKGQEAGSAPRPLERTFGPLIDRLLLREGIGRVDPASRELLLKAFHLALKDAFETRQRNASGDYRPDPKSERFPEFERMQAKPSAPSPKRKPKETLTGLVEGSVERGASRRSQAEHASRAIATRWPP